MLKWVFSEVCPCVRLCQNCCTSPMRSWLPLCWSERGFGHFVGLFNISVTSKSSGCSNTAGVAGSLLCHTFYREEDIPLNRRWKGCPWFWQKVASCLWGLPGHDLRYSAGFNLRGSSEKHWVLVAESLAGNRQTDTVRRIRMSESTRNTPVDQNVSLCVCHFCILAVIRAACSYTCSAVTAFSPLLVISASLCTTKIFRKNTVVMFK